MNILMGKSITAKYENCVEVSIQDMFDLANDNDVKDLTQKCKNEPDKTKRRNVKRSMPIFYPCIDTTQRENCLGPLKLCQYLLCKGVTQDGTETVFG